MAKRYKYKRMFAVSCDGVGLIGGTMATTRHNAISHFYGGGIIPEEWEADKARGYRTVEACVRLVKRERGAA